MPETIRPDICVVGAGAGALAAAMQAAAFAVPVVLVVQGELGAAVVRSGRLPVAALAAAARRAHLAAQASDFGVEAALVTIDFGRVRRHAREVIGARAPNAARERLAALGVRVIEGAARFKDARTLTVGGEIEIAPRRFIIATGSQPAVPPIAGLAAVPHLTTETVLDLEACPAHLLVLGAGARGLELAQAFRRLGAEVTVLDSTPPLAEEDPECAAVVLDQLAREGIAVRRGPLDRIEAVAGSRIRLLLQQSTGEETIEGSHVLIAGGRWANVVGFGLDAGRIKYDEHGIAVDKGLRTTNPRVYAIGEVAGATAEAADHQASLVIRHALLRRPVRFEADAIARVVLTDPELAQVGLTEAQARRRGDRLRVLRWPYRENDRAHAERTRAGHIKVVTSVRGRVLGVTIVGAGAGELITAWTLAIGCRIPLKAIAGMIVPYPTRSDIGKWAAATYFISGSASSWVRRMIGLLRRLG